MVAVEEADFYCFHDLSLEVGRNPAGLSNHLTAFLHDLSWVKATCVKEKPTLRFTISTNERGFKLPSTRHECFRADEFAGFEAGDDFYLTDGSSHFHLRPALGEGCAHLAPSFYDKPALVQKNFWSFGLLKLLRPRGIYSLHAAAVADSDGLGLLAVGISGSGKSTLTIGLVQAGWSYLSDDAVLLRPTAGGVEALALRKGLYIDAARSSNYSDLPLGAEAPVTRGRQKRKVAIEEAYPGQYLDRCMPRLLLFPRILPQDQSKLLPMDGVRALKILLAESAPQLFDRKTMARHLEVLKKLLQQTAAYELRAGIDLYRDPGKLVRLLEETRGKCN